VGAITGAEFGNNQEAATAEEMQGS